MITVILNCYNRPEYLDEQIQAIQNQSVSPSDIWIWYNMPPSGEHKDLSYTGLKVIYSTHNFQFHGRFTLGLLAQTEYLAFFDDDTIPGSRWFENCINSEKAVGEGIFGSTGIHLTSHDYSHHKVGWNGLKGSAVTPVDLVGHAWFFKRNYLNYLWAQPIISYDNGEDIQLSAWSKISGGIQTYVPPHPPNIPELWGSHPEKGVQYGNDSKSSWRRSNHMQLRHSLCSHFTKSLNWKTAAQEGLQPTNLDVS
jgi:hypothetical protein